MSLAAPQPTTARPRRELRRVLLVNTTDRAGGAERSARAILDGFSALGVQTHLAVGTKLTEDPRVIAFATSPQVDHRREAGARRRALLGARHKLDRRLGLEDFNYPLSRQLLGLAGSKPDLVLLVNLHGNYFDLRMLPWLSRELPVVASLRDSWLFTGHCACPPGCPRWETGCGQCPDLKIPLAVERDATHLNWRRKRRILARCRLAVTTPSQWLMQRARRSILAPAIAQSRVIPNGFDLDLYTPGPRLQARRAFGLEPEARILLFVAHEGRANPHKDFATLRAAFELLADDLRAPEATTAPEADRLELLVVGRGGPLEILGTHARIRHLPQSEEPSELVSLYRAADLYVHAAPEETFCNTAAEALACGTPVVAACEGGIREVVEHGHSGLHVAPGRPHELAETLRGLLADAGMRERMGRAAARSARARFDGARNVAELHAWCEEIARDWTRAPRSV